MRPDWFTTLLDTMAAPVVVAPMTGVSSPALVRAVTAAGLAASFPTHMASSPEHLAALLTDLAEQPAPVLPNLVVHRTNPRRAGDLAAICDSSAPAVICSVGSPEAVVGPLHAAGTAVLADVATVAHARRALAVGADGLVLLAAGGGGQTGWANPFAFIEEVRGFFDGPCVLAGGVASGRSVAAARHAGYDLAYVGTGFIATHESAARDEWRQAVASASMDDIELTSAVTGISASMIRDPQAPVPAAQTSDRTYDASVVTESGSGTGRPRWSAGHVAGSVHAVESATTVAERLVEDYRAAAAVRLTDR